MTKHKYFLDTAYVIALLNPNDIYHLKAKEVFPSVQSAHEIWITEAVLIEIGNTLSRSNREVAVEFINSCYFTSNVRVVSVDSELLQCSIDLYHDRNDKEWGLTDCISFIVMKDHGLKYALTTDEHFQQAGYIILLTK